MIKDKKNISKGFAYIDFVTPESADESLMINGKILENRKIYAALSEPPKITHDDKKTLFLNNLPFSITEDSLNEAVPDYVQI